jgi:hypothetical protein
MEGLGFYIAFSQSCLASQLLSYLVTLESATMGGNTYRRQSPFGMELWQKIIFGLDSRVILS